MDERDPLTSLVIGAAIEVHRIMGPGLIESVYQKCLARELMLQGADFKSQEPSQSHTRTPISTRN